MRAFSQNKLLRLYVAWLISVVATLGSLFFSELVGFIPCTLCWVQRIFMYPLVLILGIASYRNDWTARIYGLVLSGIGALVSLFHYGQQKITWLANAAPCTVGVPCSGEYINWLGFITIPFLALTAFILIFVVLIVNAPSNENSHPA